MANERAVPDTWMRRKCDSCGSQYFLKKLFLITRQGGGTTEEQAGYVCRQCNADVDMARLIQRLEVERKRAELKSLQEQLGETVEAPARGVREPPPVKG